MADEVHISGSECMDGWLPVVTAGGTNERLGRRGDVIRARSLEEGVEAGREVRAAHADGLEQAG